MAGREVARQDLDYASAEAIIFVRDAFRRVRVLNEWLKTVPSNAPGGDPLTLSTEPADSMEPGSAPGRFGYTDDEAYMIRVIFEQLAAIYEDVQPVLDTARKLTGLQ